MCGNSNSKIFIIALFLACSGAHADELVLKEGKTIQGRITGEDAREYTIILGSNMLLRVAKSNVSKVVRDHVEKPRRPTVRTTDLPAVSKSTAAVVAPKKGPVVPTEKPPLQVQAGVERTELKKDAVVLKLAMITSTVAVRGPDPSVLKMTWTTSWDGVPGKEGAATKWKTADVFLTVTSILPRWTPAKTEPARIDEWNQFLAKATSYAVGKRDIYKTSAESFADELSALRSKDESELRQESTRLFEAMKDQAAKKQLGYERRTKKMFDTPAK